MQLSVPHRHPPRCRHCLGIVVQASNSGPQEAEASWISTEQVSGQAGQGLHKNFPVLANKQTIKTKHDNEKKQAFILGVLLYLALLRSRGSRHNVLNSSPCRCICLHHWVSEARSAGRRLPPGSWKQRPLGPSAPQSSYCRHDDWNM